MSDSLKREAEEPNANYLSAALVATLVLLAVATILNSSFIGSWSMLALFASALYSSYGQSGLRKATPLLFLGLFAIPLPAKIDQWLIFNLQFLASQLASWILDGVGQTHFREGVVLQTETRGFLTEEACSGIRSLFSSLAGIAIYGVTLRYPWWRQLFNLIQTVGWVVVGNAIRVAVVVYVAENYSDRIASGRPHEILGLVAFLFIFLIAVSTDRLFGAFVRESEDTTAYGMETELPEAEEPSPLQVAPNYQGSIGLPGIGVVAIPFALVVFLVGARLAFVQMTYNKGLATSSANRLQFPDKNDLPPYLGGWQMASFQHKNRGKDKLQAEDSFIWTYKNKDLSASLSIDCPWEEWHDLSTCYAGLGWNVHSSHYFDGGDKLPVNSGFSNEEFSQLGMNKNSGETGVVIFSSVDATGKEVTPQFSAGYFSTDSVFQQVLSNTAAAVGLSQDRAAGLAGYKLPLTTIQLYCTPETEITPAQIRELRTLFLEARTALVETSRFGHSVPPFQEEPTTQP